MAPEEVAVGGTGEAEITLEAGDCRVTIRGPEYANDQTRWAEALEGAYKVWHAAHATVHAARLKEIRAEQGGRLGPASAGFQSEGMHERRNEMLPGGSGARPA